MRGNGGEIGLSAVLVTEILWAPLSKVYRRAQAKDLFHLRGVAKSSTTSLSYHENCLSISSC